MKEAAAVRQTRPVRLVTVFLLTAIAASGQIGKASWATAAPNNFKEPAWWDQGVVFVGNWEPLNFRLRLNQDSVTGQELPVDIAERYRREHSEETVLKLKEAGINLVIAHFYKTGLDSDREDIEWTKKLAALCHKHGLRVGTYIGDSIFAETMLRDMPEAAQWVRYAENGDPVRYGAQTFRYRVDFNHPGYVEYIKKVIRVAVEEVKTDFIHFDNIMLTPPPATGDTPEINGRFRRFLYAKYSPEQLKNRFGFSDIRAVKVPSWSGIANPTASPRITDSVVQEWIDFQCHDLADYYGKLAGYARQLNPDVVIELNPHGVSGANNFLRGVDHARLVRHGSVFWSEESGNRVDSSGILVSRIRSFKAARSLDTSLFVRCRFANDPSVSGPRAEGAGSHRLQMAEAMAFNRNSLGDVGKPLDVFEIPDDARQYIRFYRENNRLFSDTHTVADVAVLRSFPSMAYNSAEPYRDSVLMEQLLIQHKIPFQIVFDQHLGSLSRFKAVIAASQECLSDRAVEQIREYVRGGGGLLATGHTSLFDDWRRIRNDYGLADVLGIGAARNRALPQAQQRSFGRGRAAYVPAIVPAQPIPAFSAWTGGFGSRLWGLPRNSEQLLAALRHVAGAPFSVEFAGAPLTTVMELTEKNDGSQRALHWINYKLGTSVEPAEVTLAVPEKKKVAGVDLFSPERKPRTAEFTVEGARIRLRLPRLDVYDIAVVRFVP